MKKRMNWAAWAGIALLSVLLLTVTAAAETSVSGDVSVNPFQINGLVVGTKIKVDADFSAQYGVPVPASFEFIVPRDDGVEIFAAFPPNTGGEFMKLSFADEDRQLIENLRFTTLTVPMGPREERINAAGGVLFQQGLPMALEGFQDAEHVGNRTGMIGEYDAVEVVGRYVDPSIGPMYVRLVGIINPNSEKGVAAIANFNPALSEARTPEDVAQKGITTRAISTFRFID